ncbi:MAG: ureidoglycolate lyase [Armatimonadota bacterium]
MRRIVLRCEPLTVETFAPFGRIVSNFYETEPQLRIGTVIRNRIQARRTSQIEWVSAHHDGEQIIFPRAPVATVFVVAPPSERPPLDHFRAFISDGTVGVGLSIGVWHALPIPIDCDYALYDNAQGSEWHEHTVEMHLPTELDTLLCIEFGVQHSSR